MSTIFFSSAFWDKTETAPANKNVTVSKPQDVTVSESQDITVSDKENLSPGPPPEYEEVQQLPPHLKIPQKTFLHRFFTPCRTVTLFLLVAAVLIFSYLLYFSGQGNALKDIYISRIAISKSAYELRQNHTSTISSPDAGYISLHPPNYCAQDYNEITETDDQPVKCHGISIPYVFDVRHEFPTTRACLAVTFRKYKSVSTALSNIFFGAIIVNSIWMVFFVLTVVLRSNILFIFNILLSFVSLIFSFMMAIIYNKPGKELIKLEKKGCFSPALTVWGASEIFKALCCTIVVISVLYFIVFIVFICHEIGEQNRMNYSSPNAGRSSTYGGGRSGGSSGVTGDSSAGAAGAGAAGAGVAAGYVGSGDYGSGSGGGYSCGHGGYSGGDSGGCGGYSGGGGDSGGGGGGDGGGGGC